MQFLTGKHGGMTHDAVMGAYQVVAAHLPAQAVQPAQQRAGRLVKQAVQDGIAPAAAEPGDMHFHAVGSDFIGAGRHFLGMANKAH